VDPSSRFQAPPAQKIANPARIHQNCRRLWQTPLHFQRRQKATKERLGVTPKPARGAGAFPRLVGAPDY